jgi:hypothetical protein
MKSIVNIKLGFLIASCFCWNSMLFTQEKGAFLDWVIQTEGSGNTLNNRVVAVDKDASNNIIICAGFNQTINLNPLGEDVFMSSWDPQETIPYMAKYDENGQLIWVNTFRDPGMDIIGLSQLKTDAQGNIYVFARLNGTADFDPSANSHIETSLNGIENYVASYDTDGNFRWVFKLQNLMSTFTNIQDIAINDATQSLTITGYFTNEVNFNPDPTNPVIYNTGGLLNRHIFLANYSLEGELNWVNTFDNSRTSLTAFHYYYRVTTDEVGNVFLSRLFMDSLQLNHDGQSNWIYPLYNERESFISKYDKDGVFQWYSTVRGEGGIVMNIAYNDGGIHATGVAWEDISFYDSFDSDSVLLEIDPEVSMVCFISRVNSEFGDVEWVLPINAFGDISAFSYLLDFDSENNIYLLGQFRYSGYIDFNPLSNQEYTISQNSIHQETFVAKYTKEGAFQWAFGMPGGTFTEGKGMVAVNDGLVVVGEYRGNPDVSAYGATPVIISTDFSPSINHHSFIAKYSEGFLNTQEANLSNSEVVVFPNPSQNTNTLVFNQTPTAHTTIDLYDFQGRLIQPVFKGDISAGMEITVDLSGLSSGMYLYRITNNHSQQAIKFVKE